MSGWQILFDVIIATLIGPLAFPAARRWLDSVSRWFYLRRKSTKEDRAALKEYGRRRNPAYFYAEKALYQDMIEVHVMATEKLSSDAAKNTRPQRDALRSIEEYHRKQGDRLWPRDDIASRYRTAFHYELAAIAASKLANWQDAARAAHWAGHRFRELGELRWAADAYEASARYARNGNIDELRVRSARRAHACLMAVSEVADATRVAVEHELETRSSR